MQSEIMKDKDKTDFHFTTFIRNRVLLILGFLILAVPSVLSLAQTVWKTDDQAHGPIVLGMVIWMFFSASSRLAKIPEKRAIAGWFLVLLALPLYIIGRSQEIWLFEIGSFIPLIGGGLLLHKSYEGLKICIFPLLFILFVIPLPGFIVDTLTSTLKQHISNIAETILYFCGYPIARTGVTLTIGQYQLLVADACSGLHSMFSLFSLGLFYLNLQSYKSKIHNIIMFLSIAPIAFIANILRVLILILITYHFGDEAGQGFIHGTAGFLLFVVALLFLYLVDFLLIHFFKVFKKADR